MIQGGALTYGEEDLKASAKLLVEMVGEREAWIQAAMNAVNCFNADNKADYEVWRRIAHIIADWSLIDPPEHLQGLH